MFSLARNPSFATGDFGLISVNDTAVLSMV
jgi:hypothetical protein